MYRLLIVDNEEIIVNHLYEIFRGIDHLDLDVYKAYGGEEAMEWLGRTRIDIVLTDIDMPGINGIELMEVIFQSWPQCKVVFLTGHSEFEYVYKAIQHKDVSYILKAEDLDKVIEVIEETVSKIRQEIKTEDLIRTAKEQIHMALDLFQEGYLLNILKGNPTVQVSKEQFERLSIPLHAQWPVSLVLGKIDQFPPESDYMQQMQLMYSVRQVIRRYLATHVNMVMVLDDNQRFVLFVQPKESLSSALPTEAESIESYNRKTVAFLKGTLEIVQSACQDSIGCTVSFTVGSEASGWQKVSNSYDTLHHLLNYRIGMESAVLLVDSEINNTIRNEVGLSITEPEDSAEEVKLSAELKPKNLAVLEQYLDSGQQEKYFEALEQLLAPLSGIRSKSNPLAQEAFYTVSLYMMSYMNRWGLSGKLNGPMGQMQLMRTDVFETWHDAANFLKEGSAKLFDMQTLEQKKRADNTIDYIQAFIMEHLNEDLSLVRLAEQVHLNPSYLSRIYKQETGRNLTEFIDSIRLLKAKDLLKNEKIRINDVARRVGYESATSFTRFFKKATGYSPQEYREKHILRLL